MIRKLIFLFLGLHLISSCAFCASPEDILNRLTLEQKVGQLFIIRPEQLHPDYNSRIKAKEAGSKSINAKGKDDGIVRDVLTDDMRKFMRKYPAGGFALFGLNIKTPAQLKKFTGDLDSLSNQLVDVPAIMAIDEEGGRVARIANSSNFNVERISNAASIGKTHDSMNAKNSGITIGKYLKDYGFTLNFAPVADINTNPKNIVIGVRAFGSSPSLVSRMCGEFINGLHSQGISGCLKHFPGHGDTHGDTHKGTVSVSKTWTQLLKAEMIPYLENLGKADSIMTAHITMKGITKDGLPASLSYEVVTEKLRNELGYKGVIITDALDMGAIVKKYGAGRAAVLAFQAGNDILLLPRDYPAAFNAVLKAVREGKISETRLNESVLRILELKYKRLDS